jgi:hypothetical protein
VLSSNSNSPTSLNSQTNEISWTSEMTMDYPFTDSNLLSLSIKNLLH